jgi:hypothetical protein
VRRSAGSPTASCRARAVFRERSPTIEHTCGELNSSFR